MPEASPSAGSDVAKLAYVYDPMAYSAFTVFSAARGICDVVWVVDSTVDELGSMPRMLARMGSIVDGAGREPNDVASELIRSGCTGILVQVDKKMAWTAEVAKAAGFRFHSPSTAAVLTDKYSQRDALAKAGLDVPGFWSVSAHTTDSEWRRIEKIAGTPAVIKPRRGTGSRDTVRVESVDEARSLVRDTEMLSRGGDREWILEDYIPDAPAGAAGEGLDGYVSVESAVLDGDVVHVAVTGRPPMAHPFRETGSVLPSGLSCAQEEAVLQTATRAVHAMGVTTGCLHTEIKITPTGPVVIEVNGRIGGGAILDLLKLTSDVDLLKIGIALALGMEVDVPVLPKLSGVAYFLMAHAPMDLRRIGAISGLELVKKLPGVRDLTVRYGPGQSVDWRDGSGGWVFSVEGVAKTHDEVRQVMSGVFEDVTIDGA